MQLTEKRAEVQQVVQVRHAALHVVVDVIQVVAAIQHPLLVRIVQVVVVVGVILDVVEDVRGTVKVVVEQPVQGTVVRHVLVVVRKVAKHLVQANAEVLHVLAFVQILVIGDSVMVVVLVHVNHLVRILVIIRAI